MKKPKLIKLRCCICTNLVPEDRAIRKGVTCSKACAKALKAARRVRHDQARCRLCGSPTTPEERVLFRRWRAEAFPKKKRGRPAKKLAVQQEFPELVEA